MKKNIILFGASSFAEKALDYYLNQDDINIVNLCDNDVNKHNSYMHNIKIISPLEILKVNFDEIIITSTYDDAITKQLISLGINKNIIHTCSVDKYNPLFGEGDKLLFVEEALFYISNLFNKYNIEYHIDHGTLLGIIRDDSILPWDKDVDISTLESEANAIQNLLDKYINSFKSKYCKKNNWKYYTRNDKLIKVDDITIEPLTIKIFNDVENEISEGFELDIKFKYDYETNLYWKVGIRTLFANSEICFPSKDFIYKENIVKIPSNTELYLKSLYGDWKKVVKEWTYKQYSNIKDNSSVKDEK